MKSTVFIDGSSGTTGLLIEEKLVEHEKITLLKLKETEKKNIQKKSEIVNQCDLVKLNLLFSRLQFATILCQEILP